MKPGDLRRFRKDAFFFFANERELNGCVFLIMPWESMYDITILVNGKMSHNWSYGSLMDNSAPIDEPV
jgi:hypothetical protein